MRKENVCPLIKTLSRYRGENLKKTARISESIQLGVILALSGGFMDAYTYVGRGHVFANAQTGNILLFGVNLSEGNLKIALLYLYPVLAFSFGVAMSDIVRRRYRGMEKIHWMQITILIEAAMLFAVAFLPQTLNTLANCMVSFACGIQVQSFRKIKGNGIATTMCIGNLRMATQYICDYSYDRDRSLLKKGLMYYGIIVVFVIGAILGYKFVQVWQEKAIIVSSALMAIGFIMLFFEERQEDKNPQ